jgi:glutamine amidotransferase
MIDDLPLGLKVPHIGWNALNIRRECPLLKYVREGDCVYYVHSFYAKDCVDETIATSEYGVSVPGVVQKANVFGTQFHPEKSGRVGLSILKAFGEVPA